MLDSFPDSLRSDLPPFNEHGVLPPGDYFPDRTSFEARFVNTETSPVRQAINAGWNRHRHDLVRNGLAPSARQLLNGSFTTAKEVPGDLDLGDITAQLPVLAPVLALLQGPVMQPLYQCDAYPIYSLPPDHEHYKHVTVEAIRYWTKWFGHTRAGRPKGRVWTTVGGW
jgi:hypothetical protein